MNCTAPEKKKTKISYITNELYSSREEEKLRSLTLKENSNVKTS